MRKNKSAKKLELVIGAIFVVFTAVSFLYSFFYEEDEIDAEQDAYIEIEDLETSSNSNFTSNDGNLKVHFIDVGQGDACIIEQNGHYMLIDAGPNSGEKNLINYIDGLGITKFDYVIGTHAHEDHIGGMDKVIKNYEIEKFLFPRSTTTTRTFESFVTELSAKNLKLYVPQVGENFEFEDSSFVVLAPNSKTYDDLNNYSIVIKFTYKNNSILFTGDAEVLSENEMLENGLDLKADVIKIGHHGSSTSSSMKFLSAVSPKYAVICLGKDNDYGHPHKSVVDRLKALSITVYRTDEQSTIIMESDGENIKFDKSPASYSYINSK